MFPFDKPAESSRPGQRSESHYKQQAEMIEMQMMALIRKDPINAAKSWIGKAHIYKYGWLLANPFEAMGVLEEILCGNLECPAFGSCGKPHFEPLNEYGYDFSIPDVLEFGQDITMQLIAEEYYEYPEGQELSPYTPEAILNAEEFVAGYNPFLTTKRPDVTIEKIDQDGVETMNANPYLKPSTKPIEGFQEVTDAR